VQDQALPRPVWGSGLIEALAICGAVLLRLLCSPPPPATDAANALPTHLEDVQRDDLSPGTHHA
jgi:hypothetical protein